MIAPFLIVPVAAALFFKLGIFDAKYRSAQRHDHHGAPVVRPRHQRQPWTSPGRTRCSSIEITLIWQWTPFMTLILLAGLHHGPVR